MSRQLFQSRFQKYVVTIWLKFRQNSANNLEIVLQYYCVSKLRNTYTLSMSQTTEKLL